jgi:hypothetical protein
MTSGLIIKVFRRLYLSIKIVRIKGAETKVQCFTKDL